MYKSSKTKKTDTKVPPITREEIIAAREELGMTQEELARAFGVIATTVSRWENENNPVVPDAPGAIRMAIEYLKMQRLLDNSELLRSIDQRISNAKAIRKQIEREQRRFSRSKRGAATRKNGNP